MVASKLVLIFRRACAPISRSAELNWMDFLKILKKSDPQAERGGGLLGSKYLNGSQILMYVNTKNARNVRRRWKLLGSIVFVLELWGN